MALDFAGRARAASAEGEVRRVASTHRRETAHPGRRCPGSREVEVAVPRLTPALRSVLGDRQVDPRDRATVKKNYQKNAATATTPVLPEAVSVAMAELAGDGRRSA
jgi:hypothetical protein